MKILNLVLTTVSLILSIIADIISIQSKRKLEKNVEVSERQITCVTKETKFIEKKERGFSK